MIIVRRDVVRPALDLVQPNELGDQLPRLENLPSVLDCVGGFVFRVLHLDYT